MGILPTPRRQPRATLGGPVQVNAGARTATGELCTLSAGGALVAGLPSLSAGTRTLLFLFLPRLLRPLVTEARVLYELPGGAIGFGFVALPLDERERLRRAVEAAATSYVTLDVLLSYASHERGGIDALCRQLLIPQGLPPSVLRPRVKLALRRLQLAD